MSKEANSRGELAEQGAQAIAQFHPIFEAINDNNLAKVKQYSPSLFDINVRDDQGRTAVIAAVEGGYEGLLPYLLEYSIDLEARDFQGQTALIVSAKQGNSAIIKQLLDAGANPNGANIFGQTPLMFASHLCHSEAVNTLLIAGANPYSADKKGRTAKYLIPTRATFPRKAKKAENATKKLLNNALRLSQLPKRMPAAQSPKNIPHLIAEHDTRKIGTDLLRGFILAIICVFLGAFIADAEDLLISVASIWAVSFIICALPFIWPAIEIIYHSFLSRATDSETLDKPIFNEDRLDFVQAVMDFGFADELLEIKQTQINGITAEAIKILGYWIVAALLIWTASKTAFMSDNYPWRTTLIGFTVLCFLELRRRRRAKSSLHHHMDQLAAKLVIKDTPTNNENSGKFALYLRAFETTGLLMVGPFEFESTLARFISHSIPLITFGVPGEYQGAGRIQVTEQKWQTKVLSLARSASLIIMVPSDRPGTLWEAEQLKNLGLLDKTVMVMPPENQFKDEEYSCVWQRAIQAFSAISIHLPSHQSEGLLFKLNSQGWLVNCDALDLGRNLMVLQQLYNVASHIGDSMDGFASVDDPSDGGSDAGIDGGDGGG